MKEFALSKHMSESVYVMRKLAKKREAYDKYWKLFAKLHLKHAANYYLSRSLEISCVIVKLLLANLDLYNAMFAAGYIA